MTFRRFIKLIREYPYLLNDTYVRSAEETREIFRAYAPTLSEAVARAKARADLPDEAWVYMETLAERIDRKNERKQRIKAGVERFGARLRSHRRLAAVCVILLIVLAYFTLIPSGKTIARNIYERVLTVVGHSLEIESPEYLSNFTMEPEEDFFEILTSYVSVAEYTEATGIKPFSINDKRFSCTSVYEEIISNEGRRLWTNYQYEDTATVALRQEWLLTDKETAYNSITGHKKREGNAELLYVYDTLDNSFNGIVSMDDGSILHININPMEYSEEILQILF